jgi:hypothetical protein
LRVSRDYLNILQDDSLKQALKRYNRIKENAKNMAQFNQTQYLDKVESFINKNIEYLEIMPSNVFDEMNVNNNPRVKTDFKKLFNDLEFWNVLTLKTETFLIELGRVRFDKRRFELIEKNLNRYLKTKD